MFFLAECPVCRTPLPLNYFLRTAWSRWRCGHCGSLLGINTKRRLLSLLPFLFIVILLFILTGRLGLGTLYTCLIFVPIWAAYFLLVDRAVVIERCGFRCKKCGYNLQGQVVPRCPECGGVFDDDERRMMETGVYPAATPHRNDRVWFLIATLICSLLLVTTLLGLYLTGSNRLRNTTNPSAPTSNPTTNTESTASRPTGNTTVP